MSMKWPALAGINRFSADFQFHFAPKNYLYFFNLVE